ncbi:MAG: hypothetical protein AUK63_307 [bacterium P3]|nr:MAG: hypothetical protein AUK63_307 [bacterium P3]
MHRDVNAAGCDSTTTLHLTIHPSIHDTVQTAACETYSWHDMTLNESGTYLFEYSDRQGCASSVTLLLTVAHGTHTLLAEAACDNYLWHGTDYGESGTYVYEYRNSDGCASADTLRLTILESSHSDTAVAACERYRWHRDGRTYAESGVYVHLYTNDAGCPGSDTLHLTVHETFALHRHDTVCDGESLLFDGTPRNETGDYEARMTSRHGCDSTVWLHLVVRPQLRVEIGSEYVCKQERYRLTALTDGYGCSWSATPDDRQLAGHEHDAAVSLHLQDTTLVTLTAEYATGPACPSSAQMTLAPIVNVTAAIDCRPEVLRQDQRQVTAWDMSTGHTAREWYVDGLAWGDAPTIVCEAGEDAGELVIALLAYNDHCADSAEKRIHLADETIFVPNVFCPSLSSNPTFRAYGNGIIEFHMAVFTREGLQVFSSHSIETEWDGTHNGTPCGQGTYVYRIRYRGRSTPDGWQVLTGNVTLLR